MQVYTARQAILNRRQSVVAYELLYREGEKNAFPANVDPHEATSKLILNTHLNDGLSRTTGGKVAFINFTEACLLEGYPEMIPKDKMVVEILEDVTPSDEVFEKCSELFRKGYRLALDDFVYNREWVRFLKFVKFIKFDISKTPLTQIQPLIDRLHELNRKANRRNKINLLAERVETREEFEKALEMGFDFFQGYFFCKPEMKSSRDVDLASNTLFMLYQELCKPSLNIDKINECFESDAGLTYKLLTFINSGVLPVKQPISNIRQALVYLGEQEIRKFLTLLTTTELAKGKPKELVRMGIVRARTAESTAGRVAKGLSGEAFLTGLLSILPGVLDRPMAQILENLPVDDEIKEALIPTQKKPNILRLILEAVIRVCDGEWHNTKKACLAINADYDNLCIDHQDAIEWSQRYEESVSVVGATGT